MSSPCASILICAYDRATGSCSYVRATRHRDAASVVLLQRINELQHVLDILALIWSVKYYIRYFGHLDHFLKNLIVFANLPAVQWLSALCRFFADASSSGRCSRSWQRMQDTITTGVCDLWSW